MTSIINEKRSLAILFITLTLIFSLMSLPFSRSTALTYREGEYFTLDVKTNLKGKSGSYTGYTETEYETRRYEVINVTTNQVTFKYDRHWEYRDSDGDSSIVEDTNYFIIDPETRKYLKGTNDGDPDYYIFDYTWIRIDPTLPKNSKITILGHTFTIKGKTILYPDLLTALEVIEVELIGTYTYSVYNNDYDPDGELIVTVTKETYYYHPTTGYIIWSNWKALGSTSLGDFEWSETIKITSASFPIPHRNDIVFQRYLTVITILTGMILLTMGIIHIKRNRHVVSTIAMLEGKKPFPIEEHDETQTSWTPQPISYQTLLVDIESIGESTTVGLEDGIFLIIDTKGSIGIVDTLLDRKLPSHIFPNRIDFITILYRLALGVTKTDSDELQVLSTWAPEFAARLKYTKRFAQPDIEARKIFLNEQVDKDLRRSNKEFLEIATLLARRKVLDYSYGQAPLTVMSHYRKIQMTLRYEPQKVLLVGDDDLLSISLARRGITVTTIEIDPYTCALISGIAREENLPIRLYQVDLREPLPSGIDDQFDLFIADPDFTIESFALFLVRGLSRVKIGGIGLINFENKRGQRYKARKILQYLGVHVVEVTKEPWNYVVIRNERVPIHSYYTGKSVIVDYKLDFVIKIARFSSIMYVIQRTPETKILLDSEESLMGDPTVIYDYDN